MYVSPVSTIPFDKMYTEPLYMSTIPKVYCRLVIDETSDWDLPSFPLTLLAKYRNTIGPIWVRVLIKLILDNPPIYML